MALSDDDKNWIQQQLDIQGAKIEKTETALLIAFHEWASPMEQRMRTHREALRALDLQIEEIASRVARLEAAGDTRH